MPISPVDSGLSNAMAGVVDLDLDQNPATGVVGSVDTWCPALSGLGPEYNVNLFTYLSSTGQAMLWEYTVGLVGWVDVAFGPDSVTIVIPLALLLDDGFVNTATVIGTEFDPTDCAPNGTYLASDIGAPTVVEIPTLGDWV